MLSTSVNSKSNTSVIPLYLRLPLLFLRSRTRRRRFLHLLWLRRLLESSEESLLLLSEIDAKLDSSSFPLPPPPVPGGWNTLWKLIMGPGGGVLIIKKNFSLFID